MILFPDPHDPRATPTAARTAAVLRRRLRRLRTGPPYDHPLRTTPRTIRVPPPPPAVLHPRTGGGAAAEVEHVRVVVVGAPPDAAEWRFVHPVPERVWAGRSGDPSP